MFRRFTHSMGAAVVAALALIMVSGQASAKPVPGAELGDCPGAQWPISPPETQEIKGKCPVQKTTKSIVAKHIHIGDKSSLEFVDKEGSIDIWAQSIIVENGGTLQIGDVATPIGTTPGVKVTIHLYGQTRVNSTSGLKEPLDGPKVAGVPCITTPTETCGAPAAIWNSNLKPDGHTPKEAVACPLPNPRDAAIPDTSATNCVRKVNNLAAKAGYPATADDYFYGYYHGLFADDADMHAYFGNKMIAVSYGGTLKMFGKKGAIYAKDTACRPTAADTTGRSWVRLKASVKPGDTSITVEAPACGLDWGVGDDIVITTTDYIPGHSEQRKIVACPSTAASGTICLDKALAHHHNGERYWVWDPKDLTNKDKTGLTSTESDRLGPSGLGLRWDFTKESTGLETRAAVGLLSRSIKIVSEFCDYEDIVRDANGTASCKTQATGSGAYYGGHTVFRQGLQTVQIQGVEFEKMGQGGRLGHYPIHFHHARKTHNPAKPENDSFVMDSSIWDSMTRWIVLHGTSDVTLARNVGYKSIGHGFYLEDGTEINNKLLGNLGVFARAGVMNNKKDAADPDSHNPRNVPGILAAWDTVAGDSEAFFPSKSDVDHPTLFWIMNGWNDFQYNMAAGAETCGTCYWLVSGINSTMSKEQKWESYASMQSNSDRAGTTPLRSFIGNSCTTAMSSFLTITKTEACKGVQTNDYGDIASIKPIPNPLTKALNIGWPDKSYYPDVHDTGGRFATRCLGNTSDKDDPDPTAHADCSTAALQPICSAHNKDCMVTVLDQYTTSFNWAAFNFAAIWLRPQWYLVTDSAITDVQQAGITMVTGGGYSASDEIPGHWALTRKSVFVGNTQPDKPRTETDIFGKPILMPDNPFASNGGPFNTISKLRCAQDKALNRAGNFCLSVDEGITFLISAFGVYQRLNSVYDGPAVQDSNAYLNIRHRKIDDCKGQSGVDPNGTCVPLDQSVYRQSSWWAAYGANGLPKDQATGECYMPNAAIGWKQPNGFYYPPAFHSSKLFFKDVDTRHFVVTPPFKDNSQEIDTSVLGKRYCVYGSTMFGPDFTSIDRQTVLNDDDGSLTGYTGDKGRPSIVINDDPFFASPVQAMQCASDKTSRTSPYEHVTAVVYPQCAIDGSCAVTSIINNVPQDNPHKGDWDLACSTSHCYGVPLHRLSMTKSDGVTPRVIRMMGQSIGQRSTLTVNHGVYYMDTTVDKNKQLAELSPTAGPDANGCVKPGTNPPTTPAANDCNINVFRAGQTYYLFQLYANQDTEQTYLFYVGPGKTDDPATELNMKLVQADVDTVPIKMAPAFPADGQALPTGRVTWHNKANGVVKVVLKPSDFKDFSTKMTDIRRNTCEPQTFCAWDTKETDPLKACKQCAHLDKDGKCDVIGTSNEICRWATYDPHCPEGGCIGLRFTLTSSFDPSKPPLPDPKGLVSSLVCKDPNFDVKFTKVSDPTLVCPKEATPTAMNDQLELDFTNVTPPNCQDATATGAFPRCSCPP